MDSSLYSICTDARVGAWCRDAFLGRTPNESAAFESAAEARRLAALLTTNASADGLSTHHAHRCLIVEHMQVDKLISWAKRRWRPPILGEIDQIMIVTSLSFFLLAVLGNVISVGIFHRQAKKESFYIHQTSLVTMDIAAMFATCIYGIHGMLFNIPGYATMVAGMRVACLHPTILSVVFFIEKTAAAFNIVSLSLLALSLGDWIQALGDLENYRTLNHGRRSLLINVVAYAPGFAVAFASGNRADWSTESVQEEMAAADFLVVEPSCALLMGLRNQSQVLQSLDEWWDFAANYAGPNISCLVPQSPGQKAAFLGALSIAYGAFAVLLLVLSAQLLNRRITSAPPLGPDLSAITSFFYFEFVLGGLNVATLWEVSGGSLSEDEGETLQLGTFLLQVSFNFIFFAASSPAFRSNLSAAICRRQMETSSSKSPQSPLKGDKTEYGFDNTTGNRHTAVGRNEEPIPVENVE